MNDPHVESLTYRIRTRPEIAPIVTPPPPLHENDAFRSTLRDDLLMVEMKEHYQTVQAARERVEGYLSAWAIYASLEFDFLPVEFEYQDANVIDRNPPDPNEIRYIFGVDSSMACEVGVTSPPTPLRGYPRAPFGFMASPDVVSMFFRFHQHLNGKEPLASMGYFCLSLLQQSAGGRENASRIYRIERAVLDELGKLTSDYGGVREARKIDQHATRIPLTPREEQWTRKAIRRLIVRKGVYDFDPPNSTSLPLITMSDLPMI